MPQAFLRSFITEFNQASADRRYPMQANRLSHIQASALYLDIKAAFQHQTQSLQQHALRCAWQELRDLGFDTDLDLEP